MMFEILLSLLLYLAGPSVGPVPPFGAAPRVGELVISELMVDPKAVSDQHGEYLELVNVAPHRLQLLGLTIGDGGRDSCTIDRPLALEPDERLVVMRDGDPATNGGLPPGWVCPGRNFNLGNQGDRVVIDWYDTVIDEVAWKGRRWPMRPGRSLELERPDSQSNDLPAAWRRATDRLPSGDFGSPGG